MDILNFPLYYIAFNQSDLIESHYRIYGFKNVNHFKAVNGRKMDLKKLLEDGVISIQIYEDILYGRESHKGMPTMGGIGCTLSHYELWKKCVDEDLPYIIIVEEDNRMHKKLSSKDLYNIENAIAKSTGIFVSVNPHTRGNYGFFGLHFNVMSQGACKALVDNAFPIDVQTDWYMGHIARMGKVTIEGYPVSSQDNAWGSTIQAPGLKPFLPKENWIYFTVIAIFIVLIVVIVYLIKRSRNCK